MNKKKFDVNRLIVIGGTVLISLFNFNYGTTVEVHEITDISGEEIRGERIDGTGEGIFYYQDDFCNMGLCEIKVGDRVEISWINKDFRNEKWDKVYSLEKKSKFYRENTRYRR